MSSFADALASGRFLITTEEPPPHGADLAPFLRRTKHLQGIVDAINLTESSNATLSMSPLGVVPELLAQGHDPIVQLLCRDRNRLALQGDLLAAAALGVTTVVAMAGDPVENGDSNSRPVFDLDTLDLLRAIGTLSDGRDFTGEALHGRPSFCAGAVCNPGAPDLELELTRMQRKVEAGARFFQTQAVYDPPAFERFMSRAGHLGVPILVGYIVPKSAAMARRLNETLPGVEVPHEMLQALDEADDKAARSVELSAGILSQLRPLCAGLHVIAVGWEARLPELLRAAGIDRAAA